MTGQREDAWSVGEPYESFMGRWSRPLACGFVEWLAVPPGGHWLDVGTGTGALAAAICRSAQPGSLLACDPSEPFVATARASLERPNVRFEVAGIGSLPERAGGYDAVVSGLALNFFPDAAEAVREQLALAREGGVVGALLWDYAEGMEFLRHFWDAATAVEPRAAEADEGSRFPICNPESLRSLFEEAGAVGGVRGTSVVIPMGFSSFDDYWRPFLGGTGPAPSFVSALPDAQRVALVEELRGRLPSGSEGAIELRARAWAVAGCRSA